MRTFYEEMREKSVRKQGCLSLLKSEKGAVPIVESSIIFPLVFLTVLFLIFLAFLFSYGALQTSRLRVSSSQATTDPVFQEPASIESLHAGRGQGTVHKQGLFLARANFSLQQDQQRALPLRFFLGGGSDAITSELRASWSSTANNIWSYQALSGWLAEKEK